MELGDREFTSEEVGELCGVTRVTVADWINRGKLSVRWTTGGHRRIPRASLAGFMQAQGYLVPRSVASPRVLTAVIDSNDERRSRVSSVFAGSETFEVVQHVPGIDVLLAVGERRPDVLVFPSRMPGFDTAQFVDVVRRNASMAESALTAVTQHEDEAIGLRRLGVDITVTEARLGELRGLVVRWLAERQRRTSADDVLDDRRTHRGRTGPNRSSRRWVSSGQTWGSWPGTSS